MEYKIYGLIDPLTKCVRYVGKTKQSLLVRLREHINDKPKNNTYKHNWIQLLKSKNLEPEIIILELCVETNWIEREKYWIKYFDNLTNLTTGGEGCDYFNEDVKLIISNKVKKAWENDDYRKRKIEKTKKYWANPENRKKHSMKLKDKPISNEHKEKISLGRKDGKPIIVDGIEYRNIKYACKQIPIHRGTLKRRLLSEKFPNYRYL